MLLKLQFGLMSKFRSIHSHDWSLFVCNPLVLVIRQKRCIFSGQTLSLHHDSKVNAASLRIPGRQIHTNSAGYSPSMPDSWTNFHCDTPKRKLSQAAGNMENPPWREAASLIMISKATRPEVVGNNLANALGAASRVISGKPQNFDYRILMVKRSGLSSFMANAFVFPGGLVETADFSPKWWDVFQSQGVSKEDLLDLKSSVKGPRPAVIRNSVTLSQVNKDEIPQCIPSDIAFRIAAIRETFEETGVLLLRNPRGQKGSDGSSESQLETTATNKLAQWRSKVRADAQCFVDLCLEFQMCPDLWALYEWWDWLTPVSVGHRRYDTMFYITCLDKQPKVLLDHNEVTTLKWCSPQEMLDEYFSGNVFLAPPQVWELSRLYHLSTYEAVQEFTSQRSNRGVERWLPVIATCEDGALSLLPGDDLYPDKPDFYGKSPVTDYELSLEELRRRSLNLNRMEIRGPHCTVFCNIDTPCGQLPPYTYSTVPPPAFQSML